MQCYVFTHLAQAAADGIGEREKMGAAVPVDSQLAVTCSQLQCTDVWIIIMMIWFGEKKKKL